MSKIIEAGPGQGVQESRAGLMEGIDPEILRHVCETMQDAVGDHVDLYWLATQATEEEINSSQENIQLAILVMTRTAQLSMDKALQERHGMPKGLNPDIVLGHSIGEIPQLIRKDVIDEEYAAWLVYERATRMAEAGRLAAEGKLPGREGEKLPGGAMVLIGVTKEVFDDMVVRAGCPDVRIAARNGSALLTVSGPKDQLARLAEVVRSEVSREPVELATNVAVHNKIFMGAASEGLSEAVNRNNKFQDPSPDSVIIKGNFIQTGSEAATGIADGISEPVEWHESISKATGAALSLTGEDQPVYFVEASPNPKKLALIPMIGHLAREHSNLVLASFADIVAVGMDPKLIKELQTQRRKDKRRERA